MPRHNPEVITDPEGIALWRHYAAAVEANNAVLEMAEQYRAYIRIWPLTPLVAYWARRSEALK